METRSISRTLRKHRSFVVTILLVGFGFTIIETRVLVQGSLLGLMPAPLLRFYCSHYQDTATTNAFASPKDFINYCVETKGGLYFIPD